MQIEENTSHHCRLEKSKSAKLVENNLYLKESEGMKITESSVWREKNLKRKRKIQKMA